MNPVASRLSILMSTASVLTMLDVLSARAQDQQIAQVAMEQVPEQVLVTGSLIHGAAAVGVPVTNLGFQDFATTNSPTTADLFRTIPAVVVYPTEDAVNDGGHQERQTRVNLRGLDSQGPRGLLMVDGVAFPPQGDGLCQIDPSIVPAIALDRVDVLVDGASATYGSNAITGVINLIMKRGYDGAITQVNFTGADGKQHYQVSQLWGRTWDGGDITLSYEWYDDTQLKGTVHSSFTANFTPWGLDNETPLGSSLPGIISVGKAANANNKLSATLGTNCTNCYAIPQGSGANFNPALNGGLGPIAPGSAPGILNWATLAVPANGGTNGTSNEFNPLTLGWEDAAQQRNAFTMTVDQRLIDGVSFYGTGFYSNRQVSQINPPDAKPVNSLILSSYAVPTSNPYYPIGAPSNLLINYNLGYEIPGRVQAEEIAEHYQAGFNLQLPFSWNGNVYYAVSRDNNILTSQAPNSNAVSAALGWTIGATAPTGLGTGFPSWTKPATLPYLNLFCDPRAFQCNSPATLTYILGIHAFNESDTDRQTGMKFDGPLFDLPAGPVRAAIGATYDSNAVTELDNESTGSPTLNYTPTFADSPYQVWAGFAQLNIPVLGDNLNFPLARKLDLEVSWRHDQYTGALSGGTSNPKVGFNWLISQDAGLNVKGAWGTSFRFANAGEYSPVFSTSIASFNLPAAVSSGGAADVVGCGPGNAAPPTGSGAAKLYAAFGPSICNQGLGGLSVAGAPQAFLRPNGFNGGPNLQPERSTNYNLGAEWAPQAFLKGLDIEATWWRIKIEGVLAEPGALNDPSSGFAYIVPSDLAGQPGGAGCANANTNPTQCAPFEAMVSQLLLNPKNGSASLAAQSFVYWINDSGTFNLGERLTTGVDWNASYDWDWGNFGAWNTGITGTYYLHDYLQAGAGEPLLDGYHTTIGSIGGLQQVGVETLPRMRWRARLGWSDGTWSVTGFTDYISHYFNTQTAPPIVNDECIVAGSSLPGGNLPCTISNYSGIEPAQYLFDISLSYNTGDMPANDYLKRIQVNFVVNNIMNRYPAFGYFPGARAHTPSAFDQLEPDDGRTIGIIVTKTW